MTASGIPPTVVGAQPMVVRQLPLLMLSMAEGDQLLLQIDIHWTQSKTTQTRNGKKQMRQTFGLKQVRLAESKLEKLGRILSSSYGIKVTFKHDLCMTDGKSIFLPVIPEGASDEFLLALEGYLDHETSHILFTDLGEFEKIATQCGEKHKMLLNALEDPRSEMEMIKRWRGCRVNLGNCREWSLKQLSENWDEKLSEFGKFLQAICIIPQVGKDHWFVEKHILPDQELVDRLEKIEDLMDGLPGKLKSTEDTASLAKEIMQKLAEEDEPVPELPGQPKPEKGKKGQKQSSTETCGIDPFGDVTQEELEQDEEALNKANQIRNEARKEINNRMGEDRYLIYSTENDEIEYIKDGDKVQCKRFVDEARTAINTIRQRFRLNLLSHTKSKWTPGKRRGKVDPRAVVRVAAGTSKNVFKKLTVYPGFDTAAAIFIDHSNSMAGSQIDLAAKCALVFGECLDDLDIPFEIGGFSTGWYNEGNQVFDRATPEEQAIYTRWGRLWIGIYKGYDDIWSHTRHRVIKMSRNSRYNTYDGEALRIAAQRLLRRPEKRKILFWMGDGWPCANCGQFNPIHTAYLRTIAQQVEKQIEVFAMGINSDFSEFFTNAVEVNSVRDLPKITVTELDRLLRKGMHGHRRAG